jgi:hypothetical protein
MHNIFTLKYCESKQTKQQSLDDIMCDIESKDNIIMDIINKMLLISIHIFIIIVLQIYFYFNFFLSFEKHEFMAKLNSFIKELQNVNIDPNIKHLINNSDNITTMLYNNYIQSLLNQNHQKELLLSKACNMAYICGSIVIVFLLAGIYYYKKTKWFSILINNILLFSFLGLFEYFYFTDIIFKFSPVTDDEIKYTAFIGLLEYFNQTKL